MVWDMTVPSMGKVCVTVYHKRKLLGGLVSKSGCLRTSNLGWLGGVKPSTRAAGGFTPTRFIKDRPSDSRTSNRRLLGAHCNPKSSN